MKVLVLTQVLPHPPDSGPKVKTAAVLRHLGRAHEVTLASFTRGDQRADADRLRGVVRAVHTVPMQRGAARDAWHLARSLLSGESFLMGRDARAGMSRLVGELLRGERFDIIHADQLNMAQYAVRGDHARILDAHNALWMVTERLAAKYPRGPRRLLLEREARLLERYEGKVCREFDGVLAVSEEDAAALRRAAAAAIDVEIVPIAIDTEATPVLPRAAGATRLLHIGSLIWPPSVDGLLWFLREVLPRLRAARPDVAVDIVGANPPAEVAAWNGRDGVTVHGYVPDLRPLLSAAAMMVVPLRAGGGMRVRILEGLAHGVPIVTTAIGCEGIAVEDGRHLLIGDEPEAFAGAVLRLLGNAGLASALAGAGRVLVEERYDDRVACRAIDDLYRRATAKSRPAEVR